MSVPRSFDNVMHDWLEEGPDAAPREDLAAVLDAIPRTRQRGSIRPWRIPMPTYARLAVAAALVVAIGAAALTQLSPRTRPAAQPSATAAQPTFVQPTPTQGWADRFEVQTADTFRHPFTYAIDPATRLGFGDCCPPDATTYQFRTPDAPAPIVVVTTGETLRTDYCHETGGFLTQNPTAQQFVNYMKGVRGLSVASLPDRVIDGRAAKGIDVQVGPLSSSCGELWLFDGGASYNCCQPPDNTRRTYLVEVNGDLVVITVPFTPANRDAIAAIADPFIDSIHFTQ